MERGITKIGSNNVCMLSSSLKLKRIRHWLILSSVPQKGFSLKVLMSSDVSLYRCAWLELIPKPAIYSIYAVSIFCWNCWDILDMMESVISENIEIFPPQIWWIHSPQKLQHCLSAGRSWLFSIEKENRKHHRF